MSGETNRHYSDTEKEIVIQMFVFYQSNNLLWETDTSNRSNKCLIIDNLQNKKKLYELVVRDLFCWFYKNININKKIKFIIC